MDWMYNGTKIQKEDYLLGRKVEKTFDEASANDSIVPSQTSSSDNKFSQVDMTKKILEDPLVNIKKRQIECTEKILQNPMRLKKQEVKPEKHTIEDHQLDMILVSRLKSYEKAGLDLAKILSITKHKEKKEHRNKQKANKSSSEEDINKKSINKQKKHSQKLNHFDEKDRKRNDKKSFEYKSHKRNENKNRNEHKSISPSNDLNYYKRDEYKQAKYDDQKYKDNHKNKKDEYLTTEKHDNHQNYIKKRNEYCRSTSKEKYEHKKDSNSKNKYKSNQHIVEPGSNYKNYDSFRRNEKSKYRQDEDRNREKNYNNNKRYKSESLDREHEQKRKDRASEYSKYKSNVQHDRLNNSDGEQEFNSNNRHHKVDKNKKNRSSPLKYQSKNEIKKEKHICKSNSVSSSSDDDRNNSIMKKTVKRQSNSELQSDNDKDQNRKDYGLFVPKGNSAKKPFNSPPTVLTKKNTDVQTITSSVMKKKLTEEDMERMRKEMMADAEIRDKERSSNVKRYKREDKKNEEKQKPYSKEFLIKQMAHAASQVSVERSIKSNVNKLQKSNSIAD